MIFRTWAGVTTRSRVVRAFGRVFSVRINVDGTARSILERKVRDDGTIRDETYWHCTHDLPGPSSVVRTVLDLAGADYAHLIEEEGIAA